MATKYTFTIKFLKNFFGPITIAMMLALTACTSEKNSDGGVISIDENEQTSNANGNNNQINIDSLVDVLRNQVTTPPPTTPYIDTSFKNNLNNDEAWKDSVQQIIDSLKGERKINSNDSASNGEENESDKQTLYALDLGKEEIYGAFANQYSLMYKDEIPIPNDDYGDTIGVLLPFPIAISNICDNITKSCNNRKIMIKSWISGYTDTATITRTISRDTVLTPMFTFNDDALIALTSPKQAQRQIEAYEIEKDNNHLFHTESKNVTIYPMQIFGEDPFAFEDPYNWLGVWVTPWADSISNIVEEVRKKLPNEELRVYQSYDMFQNYEDSNELSMWLVINAIFEVLQSRNIKYVQDAGATGFIGQKINYPVETLRKKQGICIETAVLFASVLERIGYHTSIMLIPGHAFVGWLKEHKTNPSFEDFNVIETTMIGNQKWTIEDAIKEGIQKYWDPLQNGSYAIENVINVSIDTIRAKGILPNNIP